MAIPKLHAAELDWTWIEKGADAPILDYAQRVIDSTGLPFEIRRTYTNARLDKRSPAGAGFDAAEGYAGVIALSGHSCSRGTALHEILHLWRWHVLKTPIITPRDANAPADAYQVACVIDNQIEHSIICPLQISIGHTSERAFWLKEARRMISRVPSETVRMNMVINIVSSQWLGDEIISDLREVYRKMGYGRIFDSLSKQLAQCSAESTEEKIAMGRTMIELCNIRYPMNVWFLDSRMGEIKL